MQDWNRFGIDSPDGTGYLIGGIFEEQLIYNSGLGFPGLCIGPVDILAVGFQRRAFLWFPSLLHLRDSVRYRDDRDPSHSCQVPPCSSRSRSASRGTSLLSPRTDIPL